MESPASGGAYADGHTEYNQLFSPGLRNVEAVRTSTTPLPGDDNMPLPPTQGPPQPSPSPSPYWVCSNCSLHNFGGPPCDACGVANSEQFSALIVASESEGSSSSSRPRALSAAQQDSYKEIAPIPEGIEFTPQDSFKDISVIPEGIEVVGGQHSMKELPQVPENTELSSPTRAPRTRTPAASLRSSVGSVSTMRRGSIPIIGGPRRKASMVSQSSTSSTSTSSSVSVEGLGSFATKESDAEANSIMKALEPKNSSFSVKRLSRKIMPQEAEKQDKAISGYSFGALAEALLGAAEAGSLSLVASLLKLGADVNYSSLKTKKLHNACQRATRSNQVRIVEFLVKRGANPESCANGLNLAIRKNFTEIAMKLVPHADLNKLWTTSSKWKPFDEEGIHCVSESFLDSSVQESCLSLLISWRGEERNRLLQLIMKQSRFDPELPAKEIYIKPWNYAAMRYPMTLLDCFAEIADLDGVELLLNRLGKNYKIHGRGLEWLSGPKPIYRNPLSVINIRSWATKPDESLQIAKLLAAHGAVAEETSLIPNNQKLEADSPVVSAIAGRSLEGVEFFLASGADPECTMHTTGHSFWGLSPLCYAASYCEVGICRAIVDHGALEWRSDESGKTPLYYACLRGNLEAVKYFLSVDVTRSDVNLCLQGAIEANEPTVAKALIDAGASASAEVWEFAMTVKRIGKERFPYFQIIDQLLLTETRLHTDLVLTAIDQNNLAGLSRVLEKRNGKLDFDRNEIFADKRWFDVVCVVPFHEVETPGATLAGPIKSTDSIRRDWQNCLAYAEEKSADDFVSLLKSYNWVSISKCLCDDKEYERHMKDQKDMKDTEDKMTALPPPYRRG